MQLLSTKMQQIEWRRDRVLELSSQGFSQSDIATVLQVDKSIISRDVAYLRHQAKDNLQKHIHETVPSEYQKCMIGMKRNLKQRLCLLAVPLARIISKLYYHHRHSLPKAVQPSSNSSFI
jgi:hypothetical protein